MTGAARAPREAAGTVPARLRLPRLVDPAAASARAWTTRDTLVLGGVLAYAVMLRLALFNGFFGSDDIVYLARSIQIADGVWSSANYNGSLRYGYNIPAALFIYVFGLNVFTANAWTLFCSVAEVGVVYAFAARYLDRRSAVFAALILASLPLHIALGTRIHADAVLALFLTLAFVLFHVAEETHRIRYYVLTGLSLGMVFWTKELAAVTLLAFVTYPLLAGRLKREWLYVVAGGLVMLIGHLVLMQSIAGNPLHLVATVTSQLQDGVSSEGYTDSPAYYFSYLFVDIRHTWMVAFLALFAIGVMIRRVRREPVGDVLIYCTWWLVALLVVMSFTPVSLDPLRFAMKQSNYLNLFMAPLALLGGAFLARLKHRVTAHALLALTLAGGIALGALAQHAYRTFTANSRAAVDFVKSHRADWILGTTNNRNMLRAAALLERTPELETRFGLLDLVWTDPARAQWPDGSAGDGYVIFDRETLDWARKGDGPDAPPACWHAVAQLVPASGGAGHTLLQTALHVTAVLPDAARDRLEPALRRHLDPRPATVYRVSAGNLRCDDAAGPRALTDEAGARRPF